MQILYTPQIMQNGAIILYQTLPYKLRNVTKKIIKWKKNLFTLPSGRSGKDFITELKYLVDHFNNQSQLSTISLNALMIMIPLLLQKPSKRSKTSDHVRYLTKRLALWKQGEINTILREGMAIQKALTSRRSKTNPDNARKVFVKLMFQGKVASALRWLDAQCSSGAVDIDQNIINLLNEKHPQPQASRASDLLHGPLNKIEPVIYDQIDAEAISKAAITTKGSGGPTAVDSDAWKRFLCSKSFGTLSTELCDSISILARKLCTEHIDPAVLRMFCAGRLVALDKCPGQTPIQIRPIGIGEVLRRIIGKSVMTLLKGSITKAAGPIQACAGHRGGTEAAIHAMKELFQNSETEAVLLVDASNAFNCMNRGTALHNMQLLCPEMATYIINTYRHPSELFIANSGGQKIHSREGCTQGDNAGMSFYAINTLPLISSLQNTADCSQAWFADDSAAAGKISGVLKWWTTLNENGPTLGYYPNAGKTWLILKNEEQVVSATQMFQGTGVNITTYGKKHLGACVGSQGFKHEYVHDKVAEWVKQLQKLTTFAHTEPHAAYTAFIYGFVHKWKYLQRTLPDIGVLFEPLEQCIRNEFIPAIIGKHVSDNERAILSLPTRHGGMNIPNPVDSAPKEYSWSVKMTKRLTEK